MSYHALEERQGSLARDGFSFVPLKAEQPACAAPLRRRRALVKSRCILIGLAGLTCLFETDSVEK
ncbi:MAG: hypothetical protein EBT19_02945 [Methylocystaceae bacterium]|nr:hypothetical protein [Methylocystaceae bacterium]NBV94357.1 hypothetical protein [Methylocystaceae bacterium]